jgi:hypothetical protein
MALQFDLLVPKYLGDTIAQPVLAHLKAKHGSNGLKIEVPFSPNVNWKPTIQLKSGTVELIVVEVSDTPYPPVMKFAVADLLNYEANRPIRAYHACPLSVLQSTSADVRRAFRSLKEHGFGLYTVDDSGHVEEQFAAAVLIHHVPRNRFDELVKTLPIDVKTPLNKAYEVYRTEARQGLQFAGQVVEGLVQVLAAESQVKGWLSSYGANSSAADLIDALYEVGTKPLKDHRATLGGARNFIKRDRNSSSHPAKSKKIASKSSVTVKQGFESALQVCVELCSTRKTLSISRKLTM